MLPRTLPPRRPTRRRHRPRPSSRWTTYRPCLRWDFGFTCALCLLHEADLFGGLGGEGLGGTTVEHRVPRSEDPERQGDYRNCLYACRFCNRSRSALPIEPQGRRLLDPTRDAWADHFRWRQDRLVPQANDADAAYTHEAYELDDPRKVGRRLARRQLVTDRLILLQSLEEEVTRLLRLAGLLRQRDTVAFGQAMRAIQRLRENARRALRDLERYRAEPLDAPASCRCQQAHVLPEELERQTVRIPDDYFRR